MVATCGQVPNTVEIRIKWQKKSHSIESVYTVSLLTGEQKDLSLYDFVDFVTCIMCPV